MSVLSYLPTSTSNSFFFPDRPQTTVYVVKVAPQVELSTDALSKEKVFFIVVEREGDHFNPSGGREEATVTCCFKLSVNYHFNNVKYKRLALL